MPPPVEAALWEQVEADLFPEDGEAFSGETPPDRAAPLLPD
jgi:hypothetical protein